MSELIRQYHQLLPLARLVADEKGNIRALTSTGERKIHLIKGKPAVLPTKLMMNSENSSEYTFFHPFLEDAARNVTEVVDDYKNRAVTTLGLAIIELMKQLSSIASSERHAVPLDTTQTKMMRDLKELDAKVAEQISSVLVAIMGNTDHRKTLWPIKIFMGRRGESKREENSSTYSRWANVSFPLYTAALAEIAHKPEKGSRKLAGVSVSEKTLRCIKALYEYIFDKVEEADWYTSGSDSDVAPFMHALMKSLSVVVLEINESIELFKEQPGFAELELPSDWTESINGLDALYNEIVRVNVRGRVVRDQVEEDNAAGIRSAAVPAPLIAPAKSQVQAALDEPEFIRTPRGLVRNPKFVAKMSMANMGSLTQSNPYDPYARGLIVPDKTVYAPANNGAGGAWSRRSIF